ncbi:hypothetical protein [Candidatus Sulfurimonas baltica]|uniref:Uncharacterized protein n=1 Tax=Candidatus Sulfurimonas baltica TaxID=2740404 RepID=A0A7S7RP45_9BACT|nr:hypothetical protein [Candidatus Sulfurimonas baltica]QOY53201.1 hypothetical protein HUE88_05850 [Candidatus Sulfurimonas baltica]
MEDCIEVFLMYMNLLKLKVRCKILLSRKRNLKTPHKFLSVSSFASVLVINRKELLDILENSNFIIFEDKKVKLTKKALKLGAKFHQRDEESWIVWPEKFLAHPALYQIYK